MPEERALYLVFEIDELAFIDAGRSNEKSQAIRFICGSASSSGTGVEPHTLIEAEGQNIVAFTNPLSLILNRNLRTMMSHILMSLVVQYLVMEFLTW